MTSLNTETNIPILADSNRGSRLVYVGRNWSSLRDYRRDVALLLLRQRHILVALDQALTTFLCRAKLRYQHRDLGGQCRASLT